MPLGRERILVGGARNSLLKVFDVRMPNGRFYYSPGGLEPPSTDVMDTASGWATYLTHNHSASRSRGFSSSLASPVYSLVSPSPGGATVFAGIENGVWEFDFLRETKRTAPRLPSLTRACTMYEFSGVTKLWRQGGEELLGRNGGMGAYGVLDGRWTKGLGFEEVRGTV